MNTARTLRTVGHIALWTAIVFAIAGLAFRSLVWASWPPSGDDPYGAADILELLIWFALLAASGVCALCGLMLACLPPRTFRLLAAGIAVPVGYFFLHPLVPALALG